ncbi:hypothetical protein [Lysinibacillus xylanilyticus]
MRDRRDPARSECFPCESEATAMFYLCESATTATTKRLDARPQESE